MIKIENLEETSIKKLIDACTLRGNKVLVDDKGTGYSVVGNITTATASYNKEKKELTVSIINGPYYLKESQIQGLIELELNG